MMMSTLHNAICIRQRVAIKQLTLLFTCLIAVTASLTAQIRCKVEHYSTENGLSHQRVTAMLKDQEGFMWFGSWDGINRFDGHVFAPFKSTINDKFQLGNARVEQIMEDQAGHLWLLAYDGQIYRFDKKTEEFFPLSTIVQSEGKQKVVFKRILAAKNGLVWFQSVNEGVYAVNQNELQKGRFLHFGKGAAPAFNIPSNVINFFHIDSDNQIWIGTSEGLACLQKSSSGNILNKQLVPTEISSNTNMTFFDEDSEAMYFSTDDGRLVSCQKETKRFVVRKLTENSLRAVCRSKKNNVLYATTSKGEVIIINLGDQSKAVAKYTTGEALGTLYEDRTGAVWIQPEKLGTIRFDPFSRSFQTFSLNTGESLNFIGNRYRVLEDNTGNVWINMKGGGFGYYNQTSKKVEFSLPTPGGNNYTFPAIVFGVYFDPNGVLWLTTNERDLVKIVLLPENFKQQLLSSASNAYSDNEIRGIFFDNNSRLWIGPKRGGLVVYRNNLLQSDLLVNAPSEGIAGVYSILQDRRGNLWLGTKGNGLFKATPVNQEQSKYRLTHFLPDKSNSGSLPSNEIYSLLEDPQGRIWIGSFDNGLSLIIDDGDSTRFVQGGKLFQNYPKGAFQKIRHMALDEKGNIWIGTTDGLIIQQASSVASPVYQYKTYSKTPNEKESLGNNDVQFIYRDSKKRMWLATSGGGFSLAAGTEPLKSLQFRNYTTRDGISNDYVLSCTEDRSGNIWLATENGLSRFSPSTGRFRNYDTYDGLPKVAFSEASVSRNAVNGELYFGTRHGYLAFDPEHVNGNPVHAAIALTNLQINNEDVGPGANGAILKTDINYATSLTLAHDQNIISIDYAILDHRAGNRQEFAYRLVGFDSTWRNDRQFRRATYTNLPPNDYVFEVKNLSVDQYVNQPYRRLAITILPPWWKTWWAYTLYALLLGVALYFARRYALAMIRLRNKIAVEQKLAALKMNFFTNVSHELRTPLTLIINPLDELAKKGKLSPEEVSWVEVARKNAGRMVRFINQLLDLRKVQSDKAALKVSRVEVVAFVKKIADHFSEAVRSKRLNMEIIAGQEDFVAWMDAEKLDVVIYNILGNAVKFTPEGRAIKILVDHIPEEQIFTIAVYDQGPGVPSADLKEIFEMFQAGEHSNGRELKGTGIGLALSREFVNLHGGTIQATNNEDGGLTVTVKLKLGNEHYKKERTAFVDTPGTSPVVQTPVEQQVLSRLPDNGTNGDPQIPLLLLVEDNDELRSFIKGQLSEFYRVETAKDGEEGLQKALYLIPDLIVSDIMMPRMDGIQMLDRVKNEVSTSHIPVVLLSAKYSIESQIEGLQYGADYYITKPFNADFLLASINNLLKQRKKLFQTLVEKKQPIELGPEPIVITSKDELFLKEVIKVVEQKMADTDFNIDTVAESLNMSQKTFYRKFKSLTEMTPVEFVRDMRLQRAKHLLDAGGSNVSEIAYTVGFSNPKYFSTCFREKYNTSPTEYLKARIG
jgi:signal transduction histidine kinase/ligand-binding sensor domain-containing protein/DNA-binding response OmpR family regulator